MEDNNMTITEMIEKGYTDEEIMAEVRSTRKETETENEKAAMIEKAKMDAVDAIVDFMALAFDAEDGKYDELFEAMRASMSEVLDEAVANGKFIKRIAKLGGREFGTEKEVKTAEKEIKVTKVDDIDTILKAFVSML